MLVMEIGHNHNGDMELARKLIYLAKKNGADLVKFQLYDHNLLYKDHPEIPDVALSFDEAKMLFEYGLTVGIEVFFSLFGMDRFQWCEKMGVKRYKIASSQNNNAELVEAIADTGKEAYISAQTWDEPMTTTFYKLLYCVPKYPTTAEDLHFDRVNFNGVFNGYSCHYIGLDACKSAIRRGAKIIEKHFTLDKEMKGPDHFHSMTPDELKELRMYYDTVNPLL